MPIKYIIDTSAILSGKLNLNSEDYVFPSGVIEEVKNGNFKYILDSVEKIDIRSPEIKYVNEVIKIAKETGDFYVLSKTDIDVIALALEFNGIIISDDYAIQNIAAYLNIPYNGASISTISKRIKWKYRCTGCHKIFFDYAKICPVCGHNVKRYTKK